MKKLIAVISVLLLCSVGTAFASKAPANSNAKNVPPVQFETFTPVLTVTTKGNDVSAAAMLHTANGNALKGLTQAASKNDTIVLKTEPGPV